MIKKLFYFILALVAITWGVSHFTKNRKPLGSVNNGSIMEISSTAFANDSLIPDTYTCSGEGINPPLEFSGVSADARSLVLLIEDLDAPRGFVNWGVYNIPPKTKSILANSRPPGIVIANSSSIKEYVPLCPDSGDHRYAFTLYAMSATLPNDYIINKSTLVQAMGGQIIDQAQLFGHVKKK